MARLAATTSSSPPAATLTPPPTPPLPAAVTRVVAPIAILLTATLFPTATTLLFTMVVVIVVAAPSRLMMMFVVVLVATMLVVVVTAVFTFLVVMLLLLLSLALAQYRWFSAGRRLGGAAGGCRLLATQLHRYHCPLLLLWKKDRYVGRTVRQVQGDQITADKERLYKLYNEFLRKYLKKIKLLLTTKYDRS